MEIRLLEIAEKELDEAVTYYNSEQASLGADFLVEFVSSLARIKAYPQALAPFHQKYPPLPTTTIPIWNCLSTT